MSNPLDTKIKSSRTEIAAYSIQPYKAVTDPSFYGNRFMSPIVVPTHVSDMIRITAQVDKPARPVPVTQAIPAPMIIGNGAASANGSSALRRGQ